MSATLSLVAQRLRLIERVVAGGAPVAALLSHYNVVDEDTAAEGNDLFLPIEPTK